MKALVVVCHPEPESFTRAVLDSVTKGLVASGHDVDLIDLYADEFEPKISEDEWNIVSAGGLLESTADHARRLSAADMLVLVYPTLWSAQPAMLKGWFERVFINGVAYSVTPSGTLQPALTNISKVMVATSHGSTKLINMLEGEAGKLMAQRTLRTVFGWRTKVTWVALYDIDRASDAKRTAFLARVGQAARRL